MMRFMVVAVAAVVVTSYAALAERPPEDPKDAQVVVTGELTGIAFKEEKVGPNKDGIATDYTAELKVAAVEKGEGIKVGDTIKITWMHMTTKPTGSFVGGYGHDYKVKKGDTVKAYLMKRGGSVLEVAYDQHCMVKVKK